MNIYSKIMQTGMALVALCGLTSCPYEHYDGGDGYYEPIYMTRPELEASVRFDSAQPLYSAGKIYVRAHQLFICEPYKGVHVIDNSNPQKPRPTDFIAIPGCVDVAVRGNILYADNAVDLVAVDLDQRKVVAREQNAFKSIVPPNVGWWWGDSEEGSGKIIVGFVKKESRSSNYSISK
ncbi:MAG: hypothetical protein LBJ57_03705 [Prevotellaceae bacterium]|jgi:hypothetical protein|nr:hypothetical protein [Prevotellaceae bacterium]